MTENKFDSEICVDCNKSCNFGSGRYVNRYAVFNDEFEGWRCGICAEELDNYFEEMTNEND